MAKKARTRNYAKEGRWEATTEQKKRRAGRNKARRAALKSGAVKKGDNKEVHHKNGNPRDNRKGNVRVISKSANRSMGGKTHKGKKKK